jgi:hypothetical protein
VTPKVPLREALRDRALLGNVLAGESWKPWRTLLIASMGEALIDDEERAIFERFTGRDLAPQRRVNELAIVAGRRGGKTRALALLATYIAALCDHTDALAAGERGIVLCVAQGTDIARKIIEFCLSDFESSDILRQLVRGRSADAIELVGGVSIEARPASFRKLRGPTYVAVIADELAFWYTETDYANPDVEVIAACRPALLTTGGPLLMASSPYAKRGVLWDTFRRHWGPDGAAGVLVAKATTTELNPTIPQAEIERELERDRARNTAELLAEFRGDLETFVSLELVEACVADYVELAPVSGAPYHAFCDPAGGSGPDAFALAISHRDGQQILVDCVREVRPPFMATAVVEQFAALLRMYGVLLLQGDKWGGGIVPELFGRAGIRYEQGAQIKSDIYASVLPLLNSGRVTLPRNERLVHQFASLERTTAFGSGREKIDHARDAHDDLCNAAAGAIAVAAGFAGFGYNGYDITHAYVRGSGDEDSEERRNQLYRMRFLGHLRDCGYPVFGGW